MVECIEFLDEVEIFDGARFFAPVVLGPGVGPFGEDVEPKFGISVNFATFYSGVFNSGNQGGAFHADIGGIFGAAQNNRLASFTDNFNYGESAIARIGFGAAVGP